MSAAKRRIRMKVRATPDDGEGTFQAVVSTYDLEYDIGWGWTEKILPGCFAASITAHPTIPIFYTHDWPGGPIGSGKPAEADDKLTVAGQLYLGMAERIDVIYRAMLEEALEEWSIGFWPEEITWEKDNPTCDQIAAGDLAEASVCVRGANPETGTLDLAARRARVYIEGDEQARKGELLRVRSVLGVTDLGQPRQREEPAGHMHAHHHGDAEPHTHQHTHGNGNYDHDGDDPEVTHAHSHPDPTADAARAARVERAWQTPWGRQLLAESRAK